jgi:hypothetical protein
LGCSVAHLQPNLRVPTTLTLAAMLVCISLPAQNSSPDPDLTKLGGAAKLLSFTGQISYIRSGDSTPWALHAGDLVQPQQVVVTGADGWGIFQVSDGSKFEVFPNSKVVFRANRSEWRDMLELWLGKVRVQVEHFGTVPNHNTVRTPSAVISVRGTVFDVTFDDETETTLVQDEEGSVAVRHLLRPGPDKVLQAGDSVRIYKNEPLAKANVDKGAVFKRAIQAASDAFYQLALNGQRAGTAIAKVPSANTGGAGDKNNAPPPPAGPPPPPPPPQ